MENNKLGTISLICGIVGLLLSCFVVGIIPCIASIVLSIMVLRDGRLKHGTATAGLICSIIGVTFGILVIVSSASVSSNKNSTSAEQNSPVIEIAETEAQTPTVSPSPTETPTPTVIPTDTPTPEPTEEPKSTIPEKSDFDDIEGVSYKDILRFPDDNIGKKIVVTVKIAQVCDGGIFDDGKYYRAYADDGSGYYWGDEYYLFDCREDGLKILQDDIITVYGEVSGTEDITRALTWTSDEVAGIKMYYSDLIDE